MYTQFCEKYRRWARATKVTITSRHGHRQLSYMQELGMGNRRYLLLDTDHGDARILPADAVAGAKPFVEPQEVAERRMRALAALAAQQQE